jgi:hypothetical protein
VTSGNETQEEVRAGVKSVPAPTPSLSAKTLLLLVKLYQVGLSPLLGPRCRFEPTCSRYFADALIIHGVWRGGLLGLWRLLRCHPLSKGGYDPVPGSGCPPTRRAREEVGESPSRSAWTASKCPLHSNSRLDDTSKEIRLSGVAAQGLEEEDAVAWKGRGKR